jgi:hypothetical protein
MQDVIDSGYGLYILALLSILLLPLLHSLLTTNNVDQALKNMSKEELESHMRNRLEGNTDDNASNASTGLHYNSKGVLITTCKKRIIALRAIKPYIVSL